MVSDVVEGLEDKFARMLKKAVVAFFKIQFPNMLKRGGKTNETVSQDGLCSIRDSKQDFSNANLKVYRWSHFPGLCPVV
jgi:hypothetical protein